MIKIGDVQSARKEYLPGPRVEGNYFVEAKKVTGEKNGNTWVACDFTWELRDTENEQVKGARFTERIFDNTLPSPGTDEETHQNRLNATLQKLICQKKK